MVMYKIDRRGWGVGGGSKNRILGQTQYVKLETRFDIYTRAKIKPQK